MLKIVALLSVWFILGCVVCASVDDDERRLFKWAKSAPVGLYVPALLAWPVVLWFWLRRR